MFLETSCKAISHTCILKSNIHMITMMMMIIMITISSHHRTILSIILLVIIISQRISLCVKILATTRDASLSDQPLINWLDKVLDVERATEELGKPLETYV